MRVWGVVPAAGAGSRIQPLTFSKALLPVGSRTDGPDERPRAVSEYVIERLVAGGANRLCFVIGPGKSDLVEFYGGQVFDTPVCYAVQTAPAGLCDAVFRTLPVVAPEDRVLIGLPDTVWFPVDALGGLPRDRLALLLFPVSAPEQYDAVVTRPDESVIEVQVKRPDPSSNWVWGAMGMPGHVFHVLHALWQRRGREDEYLGTLVNAYIESGGTVAGVAAGQAYVDVGTLHGYREALALLSRRGAVEVA